MVAVPDRLDERVREAEEEDVLDRRLAEEVVDAEDALLGEDAQQRVVQRPCRGQVATERFLDDDAALLGEPGGADVVDDRREQVRRDRQVVHRALAVAQRLAQVLERARIVVADAGEPHEFRELRPGIRIEPVAAGLEALPGTFTKLLEIPFPAAHAHDRNVEVAGLDHPLQRGVDLLERQVARRAEEDECVTARLCASPRASARGRLTRLLRAHRASGARPSPALRAARRDRRTGRASPTAGGVRPHPRRAS